MLDSLLATMQLPPRWNGRGAIRRSPHAPWQRWRRQDRALISVRRRHLLPGQGATKVATPLPSESYQREQARWQETQLPKHTTAQHPGF